MVVTCTITDAAFVDRSANLLRVDPAGRTLAVLGVLRDDGLQGDATAGDRIYTLRTTLTEPAPGQVRLRISAAFRGLLQRVLSDTLLVDVVTQGGGPAPLPSAGRLEFCADKTATGPPHPPRLSPPPAYEIQSDGSVLAKQSQALVGETGKMWNIGQTVRVKLMGGSPFVRERVERYAQEWTSYANIRFRFVERYEYAEIRVAFDRGGSWSLIGRDALWIPFDFATMNFGWFDDNTEETEFSRTVLHEFGHALGLRHEHQSPASGIQWNREKAYEHFYSEYGWSRGEVDSQVFERASVNSTNYSTYDSQSIMHYYVPPLSRWTGKDRHTMYSFLKPTRSTYAGGTRFLRRRPMLPDCCARETIATRSTSR